MSKRPSYEELSLSRHAARRCAQRSVQESAIRAALRWGRRYWSHGDVVYRLDRRSVENARRQGASVDRFEGTTLVVTGDGCIRTAWKNRNPRRVRR